VMSDFLERMKAAMASEIAGGGNKEMVTTVGNFLLHGIQAGVEIGIDELPEMVSFLEKWKRGIDGCIYVVDEWE
jgi:hypothetical protein